MKRTFLALALIFFFAGVASAQRLDRREAPRHRGVEQVPAARHLAGLVGQLDLRRVPESEGVEPRQAQRGGKEQSPTPTGDATEAV